MDFQNKSRRGILIGTATGITAAGVLGLAGLPLTAQAATGGNAQDVAILNTALSLENEGIAAYQLGAESKLLSADVLKVAVTFQSHHKQHRDTLIGAIKSLGGTPVQPKTEAEYAKELNAASLKNQTDVLKLALKLERGAANAYLGVITSLDKSPLYLAAARIGADEAFHAGVLGFVLGQPIPEKAPLFG